MYEYQFLIDADILTAEKNLYDLPENARRGLTLETLQYFHCGYIAEWTPPQSRFQNTYFVPTPRLIIPSGGGYLARLTVPIENYSAEARKTVKAKMHAGKIHPFNFDAVSETELNIIVEGEIDAMSIWQAVGGKYPAIATGGADNFTHFVQKLNETRAEQSLKFLILFDNDAAGRNAAAKFVNALSAKHSASAKFLEPNQDANAILQSHGTNALAEILSEIFSANARD